MNALNVAVQERPTPEKCAIAPESNTQCLPSDLPRGCLLRIGPNLVEDNYKYNQMGFFDGDGMVHCITLPPPADDQDDNGFDDDDIMYSSTYVETKGRELEKEYNNKNNNKNNKDGNNNNNNNKAFFAGTLGAAPKGLPMLSALLQNGLTFGTLAPQKDTCNTALAVSGDRVLALMEQSPPSEIEITRKGTMNTVANFVRLNGAIPNAPINGGSFSAHGRTDYTTKERVHVTYSSVSRPFVKVDTFGENWELKSSVGVDVPAPVMVS